MQHQAGPSTFGTGRCGQISPVGIKAGIGQQFSGGQRQSEVESSGAVTNRVTPFPALGTAEAHLHCELCEQ